MNAVVDPLLKHPVLQGPVLVILLFLILIIFLVRIAIKIVQPVAVEPTFFSPVDWATTSSIRLNGYADYKKVLRIKPEIDFIWKSDGSTSDFYILDYSRKVAHFGTYQATIVGVSSTKAGIQPLFKGGVAQPLKLMW